MQPKLVANFAFVLLLTVVYGAVDWANYDTNVLSDFAQTRPIMLEAVKDKADLKAVNSLDGLKKKVRGMETYLSGLNINLNSLNYDATNEQKEALKNVPELRQKFIDLQPRVRQQGAEQQLPQLKKEYETLVDELYAKNVTIFNKRVAAHAEVEKGEKFLKDKPDGGYDAPRQFMQMYGKNNLQLGNSNNREDANRRASAVERLLAGIQERKHELERNANERQKTTLGKMPEFRQKLNELRNKWNQGFPRPDDAVVRDDWRKFSTDLTQGTLDDLVELSKKETVIDKSGAFLKRHNKANLTMDFDLVDKFARDFGRDKRDLKNSVKTKAHARTAVNAMEMYMKDIAKREKELKMKATKAQNTTIDKLKNYLPAIETSRDFHIEGQLATEASALERWKSTVDDLDTTVGLSNMADLADIDTPGTRLRRRLRAFTPKQLENRDNAVDLAKDFNGAKYLTSKTDAVKMLTAVETLVKSTAPPPPPAGTPEGVTDPKLADITKLKQNIMEGKLDDAKLQEQLEETMSHSEIASRTQLAIKQREDELKKHAAPLAVSQFAALFSLVLGVALVKN